MTIIPGVLTSVVLLALTKPSGSFECRIQAVYEVDSAGALRSHRAADLQLGKQFRVDRETGRISGEWFSTEGATGVKVVRPGDSSNAFIATARDAKNFHLLKIDVWMGGPSKPFIIFTSFGDVATGLCRELR